MFVFNNEKLAPFDIILVRFPADENSLKVRHQCKSQYSHAIVYIGDDSFIEGVAPIVTLFATHRHYFPNLADIKVLRLKPEYDPLFNIQEAERFIRSIAYCEYSDTLLYRILLKGLHKSVTDRFHEELLWTGGIVCTTLVTLPYFAGGIDISECGEPYYAHFGDIESSPFFFDVTEAVFTELESIDPEYSFDYFSGQQTGAITEANANAAYELNKLVKEIFNDLRDNSKDYFSQAYLTNELLFSNWEDIYSILQKTFNSTKGKEIDEMICQKIIETEFNLLWFKEVHSKPMLFFPVSYFIEDLSNLRPIHRQAHYQLTQFSFINYLEKLDATATEFFKRFRSTPCKTFHILLIMYRSYYESIDVTVNEYKYIANNYDRLIRDYS